MCRRVEYSLPLLPGLWLFWQGDIWSNLASFHATLIRSVNIKQVDLVNTFEINTVANLCLHRGIVRSDLPGMVVQILVIAAN